MLARSGRYRVRVPANQPPVQQPPPVQRLRVRYAKRGRARFTSHRDFSRAFERALVRAGVPMAYSSGFNPHLRISYANASPTGAATEAEYLEIALAAMCDPAAVKEALDAALPPGLDVVSVVESTGASLTDILQVSRWEVDFVTAAPEVLAAAVEDFLASDGVEVSRMTKSGMRRFDTRATVLVLRPGRSRIELWLTPRWCVPTTSSRACGSLRRSSVRTSRRSWRGSSRGSGSTARSPTRSPDRVPRACTTSRGPVRYWQPAGRHPDVHQ